ncbi:MAG: ribonuclease R, partial [Acidobacteria bacterium]
MTDNSLRGRVLALLSHDGKPVSIRELVRRLDLDAEARRELKPVLRRLLEDGEAVKIRGTRIGLPSRMNLVVGRLTCNPAGFGFVIPETRRPGQKDLYVSAVNLKEALHGDRVVARVERMTPKGPEGRIIRVLERGLQRMVGRYEQDGRFGGHVVPFDRRVLHELFIPAGDEGGAKAGEMVRAEITRPPTATRNPIGRVLQVLGVITDPGV